MYLLHFNRFMFNDEENQTVVTKLIAEVQSLNTSFQASDIRCKFNTACYSILIIIALLYSCSLHLLQNPEPTELNEAPWTL